MTAAHRAALARGHHERVHAPVAVIGLELARQLGVKREARAGQRTERRAVAPVEGQEAARLPRRGAGHARALDHGDRDAATREEVRHRGAHHAGTTDDDTTRRAHGRLPAVSWPSSLTRITT